MKRNNEKTLLEILTGRVVLLFLVMLVISVIYSFFLIRANGISNMQKICYDEAEMTTMLIDNLQYDMSAVAANYIASDDILLLLDSGYLQNAERIQKAFHLIEDYKPAFLTHKYFHSFCLIDRDRNSYYSFNNPGVSFLEDFEKLALEGNSIDDFSGFTGAYSVQSSSGRKVPFHLMSLVNDIYRRDSLGNREYFGKVIITVNIGDFLQSLQKESAFFDDTGLLNSRMQSLFMMPDEESEEKSDFTQDLMKAKDFLTVSDGLYYKCKSQDENIWLVLFKKNASFIRYTDARIIGFLIFMVCVTLGAVLLMLMPILRKFSLLIQKLESAFRNVGNNNYEEPLQLTGSSELVHIADGFNQMTEKIRRNTQEQLLQERKQQELRFELLVSQMNPHFIYNTLNSVIYLARKNKCDDVIQITASFISLLQSAVYFNEEETWTTAQNELKTVEEYERIQKYRYGKTVTFHNDLAEEARNCKMPRYILVPLIENALLHGICETDRDGNITVSVSRSDSRLQLQVSDDGIGMTPETLREVMDSAQAREPSKKGMYSIGLSNICDRLSFLYQELYSLEIESKPDEGTTVTIQLPAQA